MTLDGITNAPENPEHLENAESPIFVTLDGITNDPENPEHS